MRRRWIHPQKARYYQVELLQDLLGDWTLVLSWGGLRSRQGGIRILAVAGEALGLEQREAIGKRRRQRGYVQLSGLFAEDAEILRDVRATVPVHSRPVGDRDNDLFQATTAVSAEAPKPPG
ncbi:WGR domain-containing protein [Thiocystis violacea]|uniref:WGR domain-containing protein n=1 Tax=Thiocystis violacea TaxID=13725 RepID=UPI0030B88A88